MDGRGGGARIIADLCFVGYLWTGSLKVLPGTPLLRQKGFCQPANQVV